MTKSLILLILYSLLPFHDFHVSHTTLHYNKAQESIEITRNATSIVTWFFTNYILHPYDF